MVQLIIVFLSLSVIQVCAITIDEIRQSMQSTVFRDTFEIKAKTTMSAEGLNVIVQTHFIQKGAEKLWIEIQSPMLKQRTVRNGAKMLAVDIKSGKSTVTKFDSAQFANLRSPVATITPTILDSGDWSVPINEAQGKYRLESTNRTLWYDATKGRLDRIVDRSTQGVNSITDLTYRDNCETTNCLLSMYTQISITEKGVTQKSTVLVEFLTWKSTVNLPDRLFEFE